ncbi:MAG: formate/nitrite transporter family protein [Treponema sp.]
MHGKSCNDPHEILDVILDRVIEKTSNPLWKQFLLSFLAGAFVAFVSAGSNMAAFGLLADSRTYGLGKLVAGLIFPTGLMLVLFAGGELFTGNSLIAVGVFEKKIRLTAMLKNWGIVYIGNLIGSLFLVFLIIESGQLESGDYLLGGMTVKIAYNKISLHFKQAVVLGLLCNWLVCLTIWLCCAAKNLIGKLFAAFFPICLCMTSGFEHGVANMYYIPAGIIAKSFEPYAAASGISAGALAQLNWKSLFIHNLIPVTIGNIIGGVVFVALIYTVCYRKRA